jgi:hypothetical protein
VSLVDDRHLGAFRIDLSLINHHPKLVRDLMARMIVLRADYKIEWNAVEYMAICSEFDEMNEYDAARYYDPQFFLHEDGRVTFEGWK